LLGPNFDFLTGLMKIGEPFLNYKDFEINNSVFINFAAVS
jgi:hypothetical protein